jgi:hypothetical protein
MPSIGIEPISRAPEAHILSIELRGPNRALDNARASMDEQCLLTNKLSVCEK